MSDPPPLRNDLGMAQAAVLDAKKPIEQLQAVIDNNGGNITRVQKFKMGHLKYALQTSLEFEQRELGRLGVRLGMDAGTEEQRKRLTELTQEISKVKNEIKSLELTAEEKQRYEAARKSKAIRFRDAFVAEGITMPTSGGPPPDPDAITPEIMKKIIKRLIKPFDSNIDYEGEDQVVYANNLWKVAYGASYASASSVTPDKSPDWEKLDVSQMSEPLKSILTEILNGSSGSSASGSSPTNLQAKLELVRANIAKAAANAAGGRRKHVSRVKRKTARKTKRKAKKTRGRR